ncbi:MAG: hypothetical protein QOI83_1809, partial [Streptomycetaceae bacterium]|nr:hypothetical protein [Streptomycetaceae bacterium]
MAGADAVSLPEGSGAAAGSVALGDAGVGDGGADGAEGGAEADCATDGATDGAADGAGATALGDGGGARPGAGGTMGAFVRSTTGTVLGRAGVGKNGTCDCPCA